MKLTTKEYKAIRDALMSSDIIHQEETLEEIYDEKEIKVIKSAFAKFGIIYNSSRKYYFQ